MGKPGQVDQVSAKGGRGNEGGISAAARELGIDRNEARRALAIASLPVEAKTLAVDLRFDDNQSVLLAAARAADPVAHLRDERAQRDEQAERRKAESQPKPANVALEVMAREIGAHAFILPLAPDDGFADFAARRRLTHADVTPT